MLGKRPGNKKSINEQEINRPAPCLSPDDALLDEFFLLIARIAMRLTKGSGQHNNYGIFSSQGGEEP